MSIPVEIGFIVFLAFFFSIMLFIQALPGYPDSLKFINVLDVAWIGIGTASIGGLCMIPGSLISAITAVPCIAALGVFGGVTIYQYIIVQTEFIKILIMTPLMVGLIYIISRLARGGG